ncbi:YlxR family protein [Dissulfuribacter thermophilus]
MCVVCRKRMPKDNLLRLVMISGKMVEDRQCKLQGRGTYVCKDCEELAKKNFKRGGLI